MANSDTKVITKRNPVNTILLILFILALLFNGFWIYKWFFASGENSHKTLQAKNLQLQNLLDESATQADSLQKELDLTLDQYKFVMQDMEMLKEERDNIENIVSQQKVEIRRLINKSALGDPRALLKAKAEIERLKKDLVHYQVQLDTLQQSNREYEQVVADAKSQAQKAAEEKDQIKTDLDSIKAKAKSVKFQAANVSVQPMRIKRGSPIATTKASKVDHISISFDLEGNDLIEPGERTISVRILGTNTEVLGANNPDLTDSDQLVSWQEVITYDGESQTIKFKFKQEESYAKGDHLVEILDGDKFLTRVAFKLN